MEKGFKINKMTFIKEVAPRIRRNGGKRRRILAQCDCGNISEYDYSSFKTGHIINCFKCSHISGGLKLRTHGLIHHPLYRKWQDMKKRCYNPNVDRYKNYGALGIEVCEEWRHDFMAYYNWAINNGWEKELQIERNDVTGNYTPSNCRFITSIEQGFNKRNTYYVSYNGTKYSLSKLLYQNNMGIHYYTIRSGVNRGKDFSYYVDKFSIDINKYNNPIKLNG